MREIQASEAEAQWAKLLGDVERGETVIITRHGRAIARVTPEFADRRRDEIDRAIETFKAVRLRTGKITTEDLLSSRHEGHSFGHGDGG